MVGIGIVVTNLLHDKIAKGKMLYAGFYFGLILLSTASIWKMASTRCWNTRSDCASNIQEAQLISSAAHPLLITDFSGMGFSNFLAIINEATVKNGDIMYCKGLVPDLKEKTRAKAYSDIYVMQASDSLVKRVKSQFGETMLPQKKEANPMSPQIWHIKL